MLKAQFELENFYIKIKTHKGTIFKCDQEKDILSKI